MLAYFSRVVSTGYLSTLSQFITWTPIPRKEDTFLQSLSKFLHNLLRVGLSHVLSPEAIMVALWVQCCDWLQAALSSLSAPRREIRLLLPKEGGKRPRAGETKSSILNPGGKFQGRQSSWVSLEEGNALLEVEKEENWPQIIFHSASLIHSRFIY